MVIADTEPPALSFGCNPDDDPRVQFDRTSCDCAKCLAACLHLPGGLIPTDLTRIADYLGIVETEYESWVMNHFDASSGPVVSFDEDQEAEQRVPTIVPRGREDGACVFLNDNRCTLHPVAPYGCSHFDMHLADDDLQPRFHAWIIAIAAAWTSNSHYSQVWQKLHDAGHVSTPLEQRKHRLRTALTIIEGSHRDDDHVNI